MTLAFIGFGLLGAKPFRILRPIAGGVFDPAPASWVLRPPCSPRSFISPSHLWPQRFSTLRAGWSAYRLSTRFRAPGSDGEPVPVHVSRVAPASCAGPRPVATSLYGA